MLSLSMPRRSFLKLGAAVATVVGLAPSVQTAAGAGRSPVSSAPLETRDRVRGLILGSFIGDALGGPIEFQDPVKVHALSNPPKLWGDGEVLDGGAMQELLARTRLRGYSDLRPVPEPYAHWSFNAPAGTITDDSRHKLILIDALLRAGRSGRRPFDDKAMAKAFLEWPRLPKVAKHSEYDKLAIDWLEEWQKPARWVLGDRKVGRALPPERMWNGLPTCCGQMTSLPLAALFPGDPSGAYRAAYQIGFFDNGWGRDMNAALVAALATALQTPNTGASPTELWRPVLKALRETDPFGYRKVPWCQRAIDRWMDLAHRFTSSADRHPARLFAALEQEFRQTVKWEAQVPFVVSLSVLEMCDYHPVASMQMSMEWGHDTDSYASLTGAFVGAFYGSKAFPDHLALPVIQLLEQHYGEDLDRLVDGLEALRTRTSMSKFFGFTDAV